MDSFQTGHVFVKIDSLFFLVFSWANWTLEHLKTNVVAPTAERAFNENVCTPTKCQCHVFQANLCQGVFLLFSSRPFWGGGQPECFPKASCSIVSKMICGYIIMYQWDNMYPSGLLWILRYFQTISLIRWLGRHSPVCCYPQLSHASSTSFTFSSWC